METYTIYTKHFLFVSIWCDYISQNKLIDFRWPKDAALWRWAVRSNGDGHGDDDMATSSSRTSSWTVEDCRLRLTFSVALLFFLRIELRDSSVILWIWTTWYGPGETADSEQGKRPSCQMLHIVLVFKHAVVTRLFVGTHCVFFFVQNAIKLYKVVEKRPVSADYINVALPLSPSQSWTVASVSASETSAPSPVSSHK